MEDATINTYDRCLDEDLAHWLWSKLPYGKPVTPRAQRQVFDRLQELCDDDKGRLSSLCDQLAEFLAIELDVDMCYIVQPIKDHASRAHLLRLRRFQSRYRKSR